jgi:hypothetical protein
MGQKTSTTVGQKVMVTATKTRPANTTAYGAEDVISENASSGTAWTFSNVVHTAGGSGTIVGAIALDDDTGRTQVLSLYLFNATPSSNLNDNGANTGVLAADAAAYLGRIEFDALTDNGAFSESRAMPGLANELPVPFVTASGSKDLYGILITEGAFTPSSGEIFRINLVVNQD